MEEYQNEFIGKKRIRATQACILCRKKKVKTMKICTVANSLKRLNAMEQNHIAYIVKNLIYSVNIQNQKREDHVKDMFKC